MPLLRHALSPGRRRVRRNALARCGHARPPAPEPVNERILVVAPSWVGDAILSEPVIALLREPFTDPVVDVLVPRWCAPVYKRMRGVGRVIESPVGHGRLGLALRRAVARTLRDDEGRPRYTRALVLPN